MAEPVRARRLSEDEGRRLQQIVRRGKHESIRVRRAVIIVASASGTPTPAIARLVAAHEDTVRDVIHSFNEIGLACLDPRWAGGRPRLITDEDIAFIIQTAKTRPSRLGHPFTNWSVRKLADHLARHSGERRIVIGREHLRRLLNRHGVTFQRTRTWKTSTDPDFDAKLDRIEEVTSRFANRRFAFDQFGPLSIRPHQGAGGAERGKPGRLPATYTRTACATFTAATHSAMTPCGASPGAARAAPTIPITPSWPVSCRPTCAGVTPTPATPTCWLPNVVNVPASAANASSVRDRMITTLIRPSIRHLAQESQQVSAGIHDRDADDRSGGHHVSGYRLGGRDGTLGHGEAPRAKICRKTLLSWSFVSFEERRAVRDHIAIRRSRALDPHQASDLGTAVTSWMRRVCAPTITRAPPGGRSAIPRPSAAPAGGIRPT
ncbi:helix-turn-helix domain-containing protein [Nonomuraea cavernae]|nr:helix-turn-helix domain-containing protein [Nonomuraea cavernae]